MAVAPKVDAKTEEEIEFDRLLAEEEAAKLLAEEEAAKLQKEVDDKAANEAAALKMVEEAAAAQLEAEEKLARQMLLEEKRITDSLAADKVIAIDPDINAETKEVTAVLMDMRDPYVQADTEDSRWFRVGVARDAKVTNWLKSQIDAGYIKVTE
jgi:hypothetical protein